MNEQERFDDELSGWMRDQAPDGAPEHLVPMAMTSIRATRQRRPSWFASPVSWFAVAGIGVAAVVLAVATFGLPRSPSPAATVPVASSSSPQASVPAATPIDDLPSFTVGVQTEANASWTKMSWRKLDAGDPLTAIRRVVPWSGGYLAIGRYDATLGGSPIWTSMDGAHFQPTSFVEAAAVLDVEEMNGMLLALVADPNSAECPDVASCAGTLGSVRMLVSVEGISWREGSLPDLASKGPINGEPLTAIGPAGLLVATYGPVVAARSSDGVTWSLESAAFPKGFELGGLWGRRDGYAAVGTVVSGPSDNPGRTATALWSDDGRSWSITSQHAVRPDFVLAASEPGPLSEFIGLVRGRDGAVAISHEGGTPGDTAWWHSDDGRSWRKVADFPPLGPALRADGSSFGVPDGTLASDGFRMFAVRVGEEPAAWTSFDGSTWTQLGLDGAPSQDGDLLVLPNGVLLSDGQSTWLGEASDR